MPLGTSRPTFYRSTGRLTNAEVTTDLLIARFARFYLTRSQLSSGVIRLHTSRLTSMPRNRPPTPVSFMTNESGDDLIVSFAVDQDAPGEVLSVILMRTPKFEHLLDATERGVRVSHERYPDSHGEYLRRFVLRGSVAEIASTRRTYFLDVSRVDPAEIKTARRILKRMNADDGFELDLD